MEREALDFDLAADFDHPFGNLKYRVASSAVFDICIKICSRHG